MPNKFEKDSLDKESYIEQLERRINFLEAAINAIADPVFIKDKNHRFVELNNIFCDFVGLSRKSLLGKSDYDFFPKEQADIFWKKDDEVFQSKKIDTNEEKITDSIGKTKKISTKKYAIALKDGEEILVGCIRDITEIKDLEIMLRENHEMTQSFIEQFPGSVAVFDKDLRYLSYSMHWAKEYSMGNLNLLGKTFQEIFPQMPESWKKIFQNIIETGEAHSVERDEFELKGKKEYIKWMAKPWYRKDKIAGLIIISELITEKIIFQKTVDEQNHKSIQQAKLMALGEMCAGIAHEVNNPLTIIQGQSEIILKHLKSGNIDPRVLEKRFNGINKNVDRITRIIRSLRTYMRDGRNDPAEVVEVDQLISTLCDLCQARLKNAAIHFSVHNSAKNFLHCRMTEIEQILVNLINNSIDAISESKDPWIKIVAREDQTGANIEILVIDSGPGIVPSVVAQLFEPFFTTKEVGKGTGLGLSISKNLIESNGGTLNYDHKMPNTTFVLVIPALNKRIEVA